MFINLHNHTDESIDGMSTPSTLVKRAKELGQEALALTDHGNMRNTVLFYKECLKASIKPILGCEVYLCFKELPDRERDELNCLYYHLVLLAMNEKGFSNLTKLCSLGFQRENFYYKPRVGLSHLRNFNEGIYALSACIAGPLGVPIIRSTEESLKVFLSRVDVLANIFEKRLAFEVQDSGAPGQELINQVLLDVGKRKGFLVVCTSDSHYPTPEDERAWSVIRRVKEDEKETSGSKLHLKSEAEMKELFTPETIQASVEVANQCNVTLQLGVKPLFPSPKIEQDPITDLREFCNKALKEKKLDRNKRYAERLNHELKVIEKTGFAPYFLVLKEILEWCKDEGILYGPRGSAGGSLVTYLLKISSLDPLKYNLLFERFLHEDRVNPPDIDVDISDQRRDEVIAFIQKRWGKEQVCQIRTSSRLKLKAAIRDICRALEKPYALADEIIALLPPPVHGKEPTLKDAIEKCPDLEKEKYLEVISHVKAVEGMARHSSVHAGGVCISPIPLAEVCPTEMNFSKSEEGKLVTQYEMNEVEAVGLIKYDFLGNRNLTVISDTCSKVGIQVEDIPLDDPEVFRVINEERLDLTGVFQLEESEGMAQLFYQLRPNQIDDIALCLALFRPGPLGVRMDSLLLRNKEEGIQGTGIKTLDRITADTYGICLYQEQSVEICKQIAGYSPTEADGIRKVIGKKKKEEIEKIRGPFIKGCINHGHLSENEAEELFSYIESSVDYQFNKSHSFSYALVAYWTLWLKVHYRVEFMVSLLNATKDKKDKFAKVISGVKKCGLRLVPPNIDDCSSSFKAVDGKTIQYGLEGIKGVKKGAKEAIRVSVYKPSTLTEFFQLVDKRSIDKGQLVTLAQAGVLDSLGEREGLTREGVIAAIPEILEYLAKAKKKEEQLEKWKGDMVKREEQLKLKAEGKEYGSKLISKRKEPELVEPLTLEQFKTIEFHPYDRAMNEYLALGFSTAGHPSEFVEAPQEMEVTEISELENLFNRDEANIIGLVTKIEKRNSRRGTTCILTIEDRSGEASVIFSAKNYEAFHATLEKDKVYCLSVRIDRRDESDKRLVFTNRMFKPLEKMQRKCIAVSSVDEVFEGIKTGANEIKLGRFTLILKQQEGEHGKKKRLAG